MTESGADKVVTLQVPARTQNYDSKKENYKP
jgi:hypothetical protein